MNVISNILYWISTGLLVPVIVLLIIFFIRAVMLIGIFFGQYMQHKKSATVINEKIKKLTPATLEEFKSTLPAKSSTVEIAFIKKIIDAGANRAKTDLILSDYELDADKNISSSKILTKMGPILGLMGTLIPMGPALVGLATGDIASMAYNMQVAFATTVVGLVVSAIGFVTQQVKERWAVENLSVMEYLADIVCQSKTEKQ